VVLATSNDASGVSSITSHAQQWASMVTATNNQLSGQSWSGRAGAFAGTNVEPGFAWGPASARSWINTVRANLPRTFVSNPTAFCPTTGTYTASTACGSGWTAADILSVSFSVSGTILQPVPQICGSSYRDRWYRMSKYAAGTSSGKIQFRGVMTQWRACQQVGCTTNYPFDRV
jgi:hypothetical protein